MDAIIGKYRIHMKETCLILTYPVGISFDLTLDEAVGLMEFINVYQNTIAAVQADTEPRIELVVVDEEQ
jgi:hypothetical protein